MWRARRVQVGLGDTGCGSNVVMERALIGKNSSKYHSAKRRVRGNLGIAPLSHVGSLLLGCVCGFFEGHAVAVGEAPYGAGHALAPPAKDLSVNKNVPGGL